MARLLTARGSPRDTWWMRARASSENKVSERPASFKRDGASQELGLGSRR
jgi:hypothetical protein